MGAAAQVADVTAGACGGAPTQRRIKVLHAPKLRADDLLMIVLLNGDKPDELARWGIRKTTDIERQEYESCVR